MLIQNTGMVFCGTFILWPYQQNITKNSETVLDFRSRFKHSYTRMAKYV